LKLGTEFISKHTLEVPTFQTFVNLFTAQA